jgi:hypothetical protein
MDKTFVLWRKSPKIGIITLAVKNVSPEKGDLRGIIANSRQKAISPMFVGFPPGPYGRFCRELAFMALICPFPVSR